MSTLPHQDAENGFSLRIGKYLPPNASNLAYVHTDTPEPEKNLFVLNLADEIAENRFKDATHIHNLYTSQQKDTSVLYQNDAPFIAQDDHLLLTNQYALNNTKTPLYYLSALNYEVDLSNQFVRPYISGQSAGQPISFQQLEENQWFIYDNQQIQITLGDTQSIPAREAYKLIGLASSTPGSAKLYVMSSFSGAELPGYRIHYLANTGEQNRHQSETLNPTPLFKADALTSSSEAPFIQRYRLVPINREGMSGYYIELPPQGESSVKEINYLNRTPHTFSYQITSHLVTRFSQKNPVTLNIGLIYINDNSHNVIPLNASLKNLVHTPSLFPDYVTFKNPHHPAGSGLKESVSYWTAPLQMPREHYLDYDILILSGYGKKDLTAYRESLEAFLSSGGLLLVDNNGSGADALDFKADNGTQTFLLDVGFNRENQEQANLSYSQQAGFRERYYPQVSLTGVGHNYQSIDFFGNESDTDWTSLITHPSGNPSLTYKTVQGGKLFLSNLGLMEDVMFNRQNSMKLLVNLFLHYSERRTFKSPRFKEQVLHKNDLLEEDYFDELGRVLYQDDQSQEDTTQVIARKYLADNLGNFANRYLPIAYQQPIDATYELSVVNNGHIELVNASFEQGSSNLKWTDTTVGALPGFRYIVTSKGAVSEAGLTQDVYKSGKQAAYLKLQNTKAFFEQELINLVAGDYVLEAAISSKDLAAGGISVYDAEAKLIASNESVSGTQHWHWVTLYFSLTTSQTVYLRFGSSTSITSGTMYLDELRLSNQGTVRLTPNGDGNRPLYAYAVKSTGQNYLLGAGASSDLTVVRSQHVLTPTILIQSFVYSWDPSQQHYKKTYGQENYVKVSVSKSDQELVIRNLIELIPGNEAGYQWRYDQNIFYEIKLYDTDGSEDYLNLSIYDPSIQRYFFTPQGEYVINREDLWWNGADSTVQLRIQSTADSLQITGAKYSLSYPNDERIGLDYPATIDERDRWYPRIHNGSFSKRHASSRDVSEVTDSGRPDYYQEYFIGSAHYALPEYQRQSFYPRTGERLIEGEMARYINPNLIKVSKGPLIIAERETEITLFNLEGDKRTFRGHDAFWDKHHPVEVYHDEERLLSGYDIDFTSGTVTFNRDVPPTVVVRVKVALNNVRVLRRRLVNHRVTGEQLTLVDDNTMRFKEQHIAISPSPVFYRDGQLVHPGEYWVDFKSGLLHFYQNNRKNILADYSYYIEEELTHTDINRYTGEISLKETIYFRDEISVDYLYQEKSLEYKGYLDEDSGIFQHLDLNPTAGHTFTARQYDDEGKFLYFYEESSEKLLNKELYFYLLPVSQNHYDTLITEDHPMRHCFSETEWHTIKAANPSAVLLGKIHVRENTNVENVVVMDARRPGGGLKESFEQADIEQRVGYTSAFWDIGGFDGLAYYRNGVTIIQLPDHLLKQNGGGFTEEDIEMIVNRYIALGVYAIIEYISSDSQNPYIYTYDPSREEG